ncbi:hypothetical protein ZWY2020_055229 [Hordeum vulgare]|nr:hypothetical protein ZWY2020_055229 [Hordeum vulgare]
MRTNPTTSRPGVSTSEEKSTRRIDQIIGPVLDVTFPPGKLPYIYNNIHELTKVLIYAILSLLCHF